MKKIFLSILELAICSSSFSQNYEWAKSIGTSINWDVGYCIEVDLSGNVYLTGAFNDTADFDPGAGIQNLTSVGEADIFLAKYDSSGNYIWAASMGSKKDDEGHSMVVDSSANIYVSGMFEDTADFDPGPGTLDLISNGYTEIFFAKYNSNGNCVWAKSIGSALWDESSSITVDHWGNVYITGYFRDTADFDPGPGIQNLISNGGWDIFFAKYDSNGNYLWAKNIGSTGSDGGVSIFVSSGNIYLAGDFWGTVDFDPGPGTQILPSAGLTDIFFAKYDSSGNYLWAKSIGGIDYDEGGKIFIDSYGHIYLTGWFRGTSDFDPGAGIQNLSSVGTFDNFFAKYDSIGNYLWAKSIAGGGYDLIWNPVVDSHGNVYLTGCFEGTADFDPGAGIQNLTSNGIFDVFFAKYDSNGNYLWAKNVGGWVENKGYSIALDASNNIYITGYFQGTADFDPGPGIQNLVSFGLSDVYFAKYSSGFTTIVQEDSQLNPNFSLSPNPVQNLLTINLFSSSAAATFAVYDALGRKVKSSTLTASQKTFELSVAELPAGVYLVTIKSGGQVWSEKVVKE